MGNEIPKPYLKLGGRTILEWTIDRFVGLPVVRQIVIATNKAFLGEAESLLSGFEKKVPFGIRIVEGGAERQDSVARALRFVTDVDLVAVHDAARPLVKGTHILQCSETALACGGAVLGIPVADTIKESDEQGYVKSTPDRSQLWQCQTPQIFPLGILKKAFEYAEHTGFRGTDDAALVEHMGGTVRMVHGDASNIKITYPFDMLIAKTLIEQEKRK